MGTQTNIIEEHVLLRDGQAVGALDRLGHRISGIGRAFAGIRTIVGGAAGLAGLYGVAHSVAGVTALYEKVGRLRAVTGLAAADIHGLNDAMELTGSEASAEKVITRLAAVQQRARGGTKEAQKLQASLGRVGVEMKGGVNQAFLSMATAVQKGKLGINDMSRTFKIPLAQAGQVMKTLEQGPDRLKRIMQETKNSADVVDDAALASFEKMQQGKRELKDAWDGLVGTVHKKLTPGITDLINRLTKGLESAQPIVEKIGTFLADHMELVVKSAKLYLMYLVAAKAVEAGTGGKQTLGGLAKNALGGGEKGGPLKDLMGKLFGKGGTGGVAKAAGGKPAAEAAGAIADAIKAKGLPGLGQAFAQIGRQAATRRATGTIAMGAAPAGVSALARIGPMAARLSSLLPVLRMFMAVIGRMSIVGLVIVTVIGVITAMYRVLSKDIGGHATRLKQLFSDFFAQIRGVQSALKPVFDVVKKIFGFWFMLVARTILYYVELSMKVINGMVRVIMAIGYFIGELFSSPIKTARNMGKTWSDAWFKAGPDSTLKLNPFSKKEEKKADEKKTPPGNNQDFRGSKFTINQNFAEGFDPGRIAVAITDDLAATADRRRQSGFAPLYSIRSPG
jgi:hypothetical protein